MKIKTNFGIIKWYRSLSNSKKVDLFFGSLIVPLVIILIYLLFFSTESKPVTKVKDKPSIEIKTEKIFANEVIVYSSIMDSDSLTLICVKYDIYVDNKLFKRKTIIDTLPPYFIDEYGNKIKYKYNLTLDKTTQIK